MRNSMGWTLLLQLIHIKGNFKRKVECSVNIWQNYLNWRYKTISNPKVTKNNINNTNGLHWSVLSGDDQGRSVEAIVKGTKFNLKNEKLPVTLQGWPGIKWFPLKGSCDLCWNTNTPWPVQSVPLVSNLGMGVWLLIMRPTLGPNGPENSVREQTGSCHSHLHLQFQITAQIILILCSTSKSLWWKWSMTLWSHRNAKNMKW